MQSLVLANQKGGVGKTTTAIHLAHGLALAGAEVVLVDLDPQGNATVALQGMPGTGARTSMPDDFVSVDERLWLLGTDRFRDGPDSAGVRTLVELVEAVRPRIDWLIVDCPPRLDAWGWTGLQLCEQVVIPVQAEFFAMHGLSQMLSSLSVVASESPGRGTLRGILPTMVDRREAVSVEVLDDLRRNLGGEILDSVILRDSNLIEAASHGRTVFTHCPWSRGSLCYSELVKEIIDGGPTSR